MFEKYGSPLKSSGKQDAFGMRIKKINFDATWTRPTNLRRGNVKRVKHSFLLSLSLLPFFERDKEATRWKKKRKQSRYFEKKRKRIARRLVGGCVIAWCTRRRKEIFFSNSQGGVSAKTASWIFRRGFTIATVNRTRKKSGGKLELNF